jgi:hypothetical protein
MGVPPQKSLFRAVTGGGEAVGAEVNPREERNQRNVLPGLAAKGIEPLAQQGLGYLHAPKSQWPESSSQADAGWA